MTTTTLYGRLDDTGELVEVVPGELLEGQGVLNDDGTWTLGLPAEEVAARRNLRLFIDEATEQPTPSSPTSTFSLEVTDEADAIRRRWKEEVPEVGAVRALAVARVRSAARNALAETADDVLAALEAGQPVQQAVKQRRAAIRTRRDQILARVQAATLADLSTLTDNDLDPTK